MKIEVQFALQAQRDIFRYVEEQAQADLVAAIIERLGAFPEIGTPVLTSTRPARAHRFGGWQVYYVSTPNDVLEVLRIVPDTQRHVQLDP